MAQDKISIQESVRKLNQAQFLPQFYVGLDGSYSSPGYNFKADLDPNYAVYAKVSIHCSNGENAVMKNGREITK